MSYNPCKVSYNLHEIRLNAKLGSTGVARGAAGGSGGGGGAEKKIWGGKIFMFGINSLGVSKTFLGAAIISLVWQKIWRFRDFLGDGKNFKGQKLWELENFWKKFYGDKNWRGAANLFWGWQKSL